MNALTRFADIFAPANNDSVINSLLDTDLYKFTMGQFINSRQEWAEAEVTFSLLIRSDDVRLGSVVPEDQLREQLDAARSIAFSPAELSYLRGVPLDDGRLFADEYIDFLANYQLPAYDLSYQDGDISLSFTGPWKDVTYWETFAMSIVSELYYWNLIKQASIKQHEFTTMYGSLIGRVQSVVNLVRETGLTFADFGTRRRHSKSHQWHVLQALNEMLPSQYVGTSNVLMAMRQGSSNPIGTNAHELPMALANLTEDDTPEQIRQTQYELVEAWCEMYPELSILLPDTFGTTQFLEQAPAWMACECKGARLDSKDPDIATEEFITWWKSHGVDPQKKMLIPSDGLTPERMVELYKKHGDRVGVYTFGIGTNLTNNSAGIWPREHDPGYAPFSMALKLTEAGGKPAVKLSDNPAKAQGGDRAEWFKEVFGTEGREDRAVSV